MPIKLVRPGLAGLIQAIVGFFEMLVDVLAGPAVAVVGTMATAEFRIAVGGFSVSGAGRAEQTAQQPAQFTAQIAACFRYCAIGRELVYQSWQNLRQMASGIYL